MSIINNQASYHVGANIDRHLQAAKLSLDLFRQIGTINQFNSSASRHGGCLPRPCGNNYNHVYGGQGQNNLSLPVLGAGNLGFDFAGNSIGFNRPNGGYTPLWSNGNFQHPVNGQFHDLGHGLLYQFLSSGQFGALFDLILFQLGQQQYWAQGCGCEEPPIDATTLAVGEEDGGGPSTKALGEEDGGCATTLAAGEEDSHTGIAGEEDGGGITSLAIGEEDGGGATTLALGEEDGDGVSTRAGGEEDGGGLTSLAVGEEDGAGPTTLAIGEEDGGGITSHAVGEEDGGEISTRAGGEEDGGLTTLALGEEDGGGATTYAVGEEDGGEISTRAAGEEDGIGPSTRAFGEEDGSGFTTLAIGEEDGCY